MSVASAVVAKKEQETKMMLRNNSFETVDSESMENMAVISSGEEAPRSTADSLEETGILIVDSDGSIRSEEERNKKTGDNLSHKPGPLDLSFPDSVPTLLGSIEGNPRPPAVVDATPAELDQTLPVANHQKAVPRKEEAPPKYNTKMFGFTVAFFIALIPTFLLWRERAFWQTRTVKLEEELKALKEQVAKQQHFSYYQSFADTCTSSFKFEPPSFFDKDHWSSLEQGAHRTQKKMKKGLQKLGNTLWKAQAGLRDEIQGMGQNIKSSVAEIKEQYGAEATEFWEKLQASMKTPTEKGGGKASEQSTKDEGLIKVATNVLTGVAFASTAAYGLWGAVSYLVEDIAAPAPTPSH